MGYSCVNRDSTEFKDTSKRLNVSTGNLELIINQFQNKEGNEEKWPSDDYIKQQLRGKDFEVTEEGKSIKELWERKYKEPLKFPTQRTANYALREAQKVFGEEAVKMYRTADNSFAIWVGKPVEVTTTGIEEALESLDEEIKTRSITIAPYFKTQFTPENTEILTKEVQQKFLNAAKNIANALGINITLIRDNLGGYVHSEYGSQVRELSYTIEFDETDKTTAQLFSSLLSDIGHQVQESVIVASYVDGSATSYNGIEAFIECDTSDRHKIADILEKAGIHEYTINKEGVQLLWFGSKEKIENLENQTDLTEKEQIDLKNYHTFVESSTKVAAELKGTLATKKIQSDLLYPTDREQLYKDTLKELEDGSKENKTEGIDTSRVGNSMETVPGSRNTREERQRQFSDLINEALRNLQAFREGQEGVDLTNQWQQGEEEHQLNVPLTPNQLARSQLEKREDPISQGKQDEIAKQQVSIITQLYNLLENPIIKRFEINSWAETVGFFMIQYLQDFKQNQDAAQEFFPNRNLSNYIFSIMDYTEILNAIGINEFLAYVKEALKEDREDNIEEYNEISLEKAILFENNWDVIQVIALRYLNEVLGTSIGITSEDISSIVSDLLDTPIVDPENINLDSDTTSVEEEMPELEYWQVEARSIGIIPSMSQEVKVFLYTLVDMKWSQSENQYVPKYEPVFHMYEKQLDPVKASNTLAFLLQGSKNIEEVVQRLKDNKEKVPWADPLIERLTVSEDEATQNANAKFQSEFFSVFCRTAQPYTAIENRKGFMKVKQCNSSTYFDHIIFSLQAQYTIGQSPLFLSTGINKGLLQAMTSYLTTIKAISLGKPGEFVENISPKDRETFIKTIYICCNWIGSSIPTEILEEVLSNTEAMYNTRKALDNFIQAAHELIGKQINNNPFITKGKDTFNKTLRAFYEPLVAPLGNQMESGFMQDGKTYQTFTLPSYLTELSRKLTSPETYKDCIINNYAKYKWFFDDNLGWRNKWLEQIINSKGATGLFDHMVQISYDGKNPMKDMTERDYILSAIMQFYNEQDVQNMAWFLTPQMSNKPTMEFIKFQKQNFKVGRSAYEAFMNVVYQELDRIQQVRMRGLKESDPEYIQNYEKQGKKFCFFPVLNEFLEGGKEANSKTGKLLNKKLKGENLSVEELTELHDNLLAIIYDSIQQMAENAVKHYEALGINDELESNLEVESKKYDLSEFYIESLFANIMFLQLTVGDIAYYENAEDLQKRLAQLHSPGTKANTSIVYKGQKITDGIQRVLYIKDLKQAAENLKDNLRAVLDQKIEEAKNQNHNKEAISWEALKLKLLGDPSKGIKGDYDYINVTDGQAYNCITSYRKKALMFGKWESEFEEIYERVKSGKYNYSDIENAFGAVLKPFTYSQTTVSDNTDGTPMPSMKVPVQIKDSEYLLFFASLLTENANTGKPNILKAIFDIMEESHFDSEGNYKQDGIDTVVFGSTVKCGSYGLIDLTKFVNEENGEELAKATLREAIKGEDRSIFIKEISYEDYKLQQNVPNHFKDHYQAWGSQFRVLGIYEISDGNPNMEINIAGETLKATEVQQRYEELTAANIKESLQKVRDILKVELYEELKQHDPATARFMLNDAISKILYRQVMTDSRYNIDTLFSFTIDRRKFIDGKFNSNYGEFMIPLGDPAHLQQMEQILNAFIKQRVNKQKIAGGPAVQVTSFGHSKALHIRFKDKKGKILETREEYEAHMDENSPTYEDYLKENQDGIAYYECIAPIFNKELFDKFANEDGTINIEAVEAFNPELLKLICYRIPTEDKYSMAPLKIVGFVPAEIGDALILPDEITLLTGSDFDVDKMYIVRKEIFLKTQRPGNITKKFNDLKESLEEKYNLNKEQKYILDRCLTLFLKDPFNANVLNDYKKDLYKMKMSPKVLYKNLLKTYMRSKYKYYIPKADSQSKTGRNNDLFDINYAILTHKNVSFKMLNPGGFDELKKLAYKIAVFKNPQNKLSMEDLDKLSIKELKELTYQGLNMVDPIVHAQFYKQNAAATVLIGIFAVNRVSHALFESDTIRLTNLDRLKISSIIIDDFIVTEGTEVDPVRLSDGEYLGRMLAKLACSSVDAAKEPILNLMNINGTTVHTLITMLRLGCPITTAALFLSQPVILKILQDAEIQGTSSPRALGNIIEKKLKEELKNNGLAEISPIYNETITKDELLNGLKGKDDQKVKIKMLTAFKQLNDIGKYTKILTAASSVNSVKHSVGPLHIDNLQAQMKENILTDNIGMNKPIISLFSDKKSEPFTIEAIRKRHPILSSFAEAYSFANDMFKDVVPLYNTLFDVLDALYGGTVQEGLQRSSFMWFYELLTNDRNIFRNFFDFIRTYSFWKYCETNNVDIISKEEQIEFINKFPKEFGKFKEKYEKNPNEISNTFLNHLNFGQDKKGNPVIKIDLRLSKEEKAKVSQGWTDLYRENPDMAVKLFKYCIYRSGLGWEAMSFLEFAPIELKSKIPGYREFYSSEQVINPYFVIDQFIRNNWDDYSLVPTIKEEDLDNPNIIKDENGICVFKSKHSTVHGKLLSNSYFKVRNEKGQYVLYKLTGESRGSRYFTEVSTLGGKGSFLEVSTSDITESIFKKPRGKLKRIKSYINNWEALDVDVYSEYSKDIISRTIRGDEVTAEENQMSDEELIYALLDGMTSLGTKKSIVDYVKQEIKPAPDIFSKAFKTSLLKGLESKGIKIDMKTLNQCLESIC